MSGVTTVNDSTTQDFTKTRYIPYQAFIKKYALGAEICSGGFGVVYAASSVKNNQSIAMKFLPSENVCTWVLLNGRMVPIEVALLAKCQSVRGVIRMYHYTKCSGNGFMIAMERPPAGVDLFEFNKQHRPLSESVARNFFQQIVEIVQACAKLDVVHLDIKPENIIVDADSGQLKLIDFGSGAWLSKTPLKRFSGTWLYAPPEWFLYRTFDAIPATIWNLGVLLYVMLMDQYPFKCRRDIIKNSLRWGSSTITFEHQELIVSCLATKPEERPTLESILCHSWLSGHDADDWRHISMKTMTKDQITEAIENLYP